MDSRKLARENERIRLADREDRLKDRDFMEQLIEIDQWVLSYADDTLKNDRELVKKAVQSDGPPVLEAVNKRFQKDKEIVLLALKKNGMAIHGVPTITQERVILRVKCLGETFESVVEKLKEGTFVKDEFRSN